MDRFAWSNDHYLVYCPDVVDWLRYE